MRTSFAVNFTLGVLLLMPSYQAAADQCSIRSPMSVVAEASQNAVLYSKLMSSLPVSRSKSEPLDRKEIIEKFIKAQEDFKNGTLPGPKDFHIGHGGWSCEKIEYEPFYGVQSRSSKLVVYTPKIRRLEYTPRTSENQYTDYCFIQPPASEKIFWKSSAWGAQYCRDELTIKPHPVTYQFLPIKQHQVDGKDLITDDFVFGNGHSEYYERTNGDSYGRAIVKTREGEILVETQRGKDLSMLVCFDDLGSGPCPPPPRQEMDYSSDPDAGTLDRLGPIGTPASRRHRDYVAEYLRCKFDPEAEANFPGLSAQACGIKTDCTQR